MNHKAVRILTIGLVLTLMALIFSLGPATAQPLSGPDAVAISLLHTNDFHANVKPDTSNRGGSAYIAGYVNEVKTEVGADNVVLFDGGDIMFGGGPLGPLTMGEGVIDIYNEIGYDLSGVGNHEWDKGQTLLQTRTAQATFPFIAANVVLQGTNTPPSFLKPYVILDVGGIKLGIIGVTTTETPNIVIAGATAGLEFQDPAQAVLRYYDEVRAASDAVMVLSHLGFDRPGSPYKGDKQMAQDLIDAGKPVDLIVGGHTHSNLNNTPGVVGPTTIVQAYYAGRQVGRVDISVDPATKKLTVTKWATKTITTSSVTPDPDIADLVNYWYSQIEPLLNQPVGVSNVELVRNYNVQSNMGAVVADSMLWKADLLDDSVDNDSVVAAFTNAGGLRADITLPPGGSLPMNVTWGHTFNVLPFSNVLFDMDLTGAQIKSLLDQGAKLTAGILQSSGVSYYWYNDCNCNNPKNWGAYNIKVGGQPLQLTKTYRIVTNDFLSTGGDSFAAFNQGTNRVNTGFDMQMAFNEWIVAHQPVINPADLAQRAVQLSKIVTVLHTNDSHGRWEADRFHAGFAYLATLIKQERAKDPNALLLDAGDTTQGNSFAFFFKDKTPNPIIEGLNLLKYDALTLGNHEFNFGPATFRTTWDQAQFPIMGANVTDDGRYGFKPDEVKDYIVKDVGGVKVAVLGLTNPRVPFYEMPTNIEGLTFSNAFDTAATLVPQIKSGEDPDALVALTHIGYSPYEGGDASSTDVYLANNLAGIDVIVGGHSHTVLPTGDFVTSATNPNGTLIAQTGRYAERLGKVVIGFTGDATTGYTMVSRSAELLPAATTTVDSEMQTFLAPFLDELNAYTGEVIGESTTDLDARNAFTEETGAANLQVDATKWQAEQLGYDVDFHLSGATTNSRVPAGPIKVQDVFTLVPYENQLVVYTLNGPQIKTILEKAYWNWWQYYNNTGVGSKYTTCNLMISEGGQIVYDNSRAPDGNNVVALKNNGEFVDFADANTYYTVSTVNYIGAGSCNFKDPTESFSLWPIDQLLASPPAFVRESVIDYVKAFTPVSPVAEGRIVFATPQTVSITPAASKMGYVDSLAPNAGYYGNSNLWTGEDNRPKNPRFLHGAFQVDLASALPADAVVLEASVELMTRNTTYLDGAVPSTFSLKLLDNNVDSTWPHNYRMLHSAGVVKSLPMSGDDFAVGDAVGVDFDAAALTELQAQVAGDGKLSFRTDGAVHSGWGRDIVAWDGSAAHAPVLTITYYAP